jgi:endoglucanase
MLAKQDATFKWQRKLMPGGACEASAFQAYGYTSGCVCLPLGNYHNMADIDGVAKGRRARVGQEHVAVADFHGLVELLGVIARELDAPRPTPRQSMEKIWAEKGALLG